MWGMIFAALSDLTVVVGTLVALFFASVRTKDERRAVHNSIYALSPVAIDRSISRSHINILLQYTFNIPLTQYLLHLYLLLIMD
jgi:hypothetical protein